MLELFVVAGYIIFAIVILLAIVKVVFKFIEFLWDYAIVLVVIIGLILILLLGA